MLCDRTTGQEAHAQQQGPDISLLDPALQKQWDHVANAHLGNILITRHSGRKVVWTCDQCPDGHLHSWSARVGNRTRGTGCPQCRGRTVCKHNSLATKAPLVAAQWDYEANDGTPDDVVAQSSHPVGWHCDVCGCKWEATPDAWAGSTGTGCPQCARDRHRKTWQQHPTLAECKHDVLAEWDHQRNKTLGNFPNSTKVKSNKQIFWLCTKCPAGQQHSWSARPTDRTGRRKTGCPFCAGQAACNCNSLEALYPDVAAEWDYSKNTGQPSDYTAKSNKVVWWCTTQRGSWQQTIDTRTDQRLERHQTRRPSAA